MYRYTHEPTDKLHKIAIELLTTERAYVDRLHLLDQVYTDIHMNLQISFSGMIDISLYIWTDRQTS